MTDEPPVTVVIGHWGGSHMARQVRERSLANPGVVLININTAKGYWVARDGIAVRFSTVVASRVLLALLAARGRVVTPEQMVELNWGDDPQGGVDNPEGRLQVALVEARVVGAAIGVIVTTHRQRGWSARLADVGNQRKADHETHPETARPPVVADPALAARGPRAAGRAHG